MTNEMNENGWRLVISDMDGTLLDSHSRISEKNMTAIRQLRANNISFTLATGRMDRMVRAYVRELAIDQPIIACNGAIIRDCTTDQILWRQNLPDEQALSLISWLASHDYDYLCYTPDLVYFPAHSRRIALFHRYNKIAGAKTEDHVMLCPLEGQEEQAVSQGLIKILAVPHSSSAMQAINARMSLLPGLGGVASMSDAFDIMAAGVSKGSALKNLARLLALQTSQIAAVGDNDNDAEMLATAGLGIAMANATPRALAAADRVTQSDHDSDGLAEAIDKFIFRSKSDDNF